MMSTEDFLPSRRKGLLQHTVDNEVSALVRLTFYENRSVLIGQETRNKCSLFASTGVLITVRPGKHLKYLRNVYCVITNHSKDQDM